MKRIWHHAWPSLAVIAGVVTLGLAETVIGSIR